LSQNNLAILRHCSESLVNGGYGLVSADTRRIQ
jgi:hypothetical protein